MLTQCTHCGRRLQVKDEAVGKTVKCPSCQQLLRVPEPAPVAASPAVASLPPVAEAVTLAPVSNPQSATQNHTYAPVGPPPATEWTAFLGPAQAPDEIGRLGPYRVLKVLGHGGMGVVFLAEDPHLRRKVALKAMLPVLAWSPSNRERFQREARAAAALDHDHIVHIYQVGEDRGVPFLAMQFLHGEALDVRLKREGRLPLAEVLRIGREAAEGLRAAHEHGLIHRDIKPGNLWLEARSHKRPAGELSQSSNEPTSEPLVATDWRVKILDFGLARITGDGGHLTQSGAIVGTPAFMAPEQARCEAVDGRCDLFSLGCVLYQLGTGATPFRGGDTISTLLAVATEEPQPMREPNPAIPVGLAGLVQRLLAKNRNGRPASAQVVVEALRALEAEHGPSAATATVPLAKDPSAPQRPRAVAGPSSGWRWGLLGGVVFAVLLLATLPFVLPRLMNSGGQPTPSATDPKPGDAVFVNSLGIKFVRVPKGTLWQDGGNGKPGTTKVEIPYDFYFYCTTWPG